MVDFKNIKNVKNITIYFVPDEDYILYIGDTKIIINKKDEDNFNQIQQLYENKD